MVLNREQVREAFHRQAHQYDAHAVVQRTVVNRLIERLAAQAVEPRRVLDVGAGTGRLLAAIHGIFPTAEAVGVDLAAGMSSAAADNLIGTGIEILTADAEALPFEDRSFDLVVSTSTFQWLDTLDRAFAEAYRVLQPGGVFCFALFGECTLFELRDAYRRAECGCSGRSLSFFSTTDVVAALEKAGFTGAAAESEMETELHPDVPELLRSLKKIGAKTVPRVARKGLSERRVMLDMMEIYRREYGVEGGVPASYDVVYGVGRR